MQNYKPTSFRFGIDFLPAWFKHKLDNKEIDYEYDQWGDVIACRFYDVSDKECIVNKGNKVNVYMLISEKEMK